MSSLAENSDDKHDDAMEYNDVLAYTNADTLDDHGSVNDNHDYGNKDDNSNHHVDDDNEDSSSSNSSSNVHALNLDYSKWSGVDIIESMCMNCGKLLLIQAIHECYMTTTVE